MNKKFISLALAAAMCVPVAAGLAACGGQNAADEGLKITVWCSDVNGVKALTERQIEEYNASQTVADLKVSATISPVSEKKAAGDMEKLLQTSAADMFFFAQDQFARLVEINALNMLSVNAATTVSNSHVDYAVNAASTSDGTLFAYPLTSDNTYFLYYDKSKISDDKVEYIEDIIEECRKGDGSKSYKFSFPLGAEQSWYSASFFFGAGCVSEWTVDNDGAFSAYNDTFNSDKGKIAIAGMKKIMDSEVFLTTYGGAADFSASTPSAAVVGGTWDYSVAKGILGDNLGIAKLPKWKGEGDAEYALKPFTACKLLGVKPQSDPARAAALRELALYLTNEKCQRDRFEQFKWRPTNANLLKDSTILNDPYIKVVTYNVENGVTQGQIPEKWWGYADNISLEVKAGTKSIDTILAEYDANINKIVQAE